MIRTESHKKALYGSHLPILTRVMELTHGPVLEVGMGLYSTPLLHTMCELQGRQLYSYDNDPVWFEENKKWESELHKVYFVHQWDHMFTTGKFWSVAFIDEKPAKDRMKRMKQLANNAVIVLAHDSEQASRKFFKYDWAYPSYKYIYNYEKVTPNTVVLSNFIDVARFLK